MIPGPILHVNVKMLDWYVWLIIVIVFLVLFVLVFYEIYRAPDLVPGAYLIFPCWDPERRLGDTRL